jgi:hypothetical protein
MGQRRDSVAKKELLSSLDGQLRKKLAIFTNFQRTRGTMSQFIINMPAVNEFWLTRH